MSTDMEKLNIVLAARDREFQRAMDANIRRIERFERRSKASLSKTSRHFDMMGFAAKRLGPVMAALGAGAVIGKLKRTTAALDDIGKTADKMGLTTDALQELRTVAESAGVAQSSLDSSMERFSKRLGEAALGTGAANKALKEMGLSAGELATMGLDKALSAVADKIADIPDPTERAARAAALFGREGVAMVNLMREGSAGMEKMRAEARDLGIVIDEDLIRGAEGAQTQLDLMGRVISAQLNSALIELAPLLVGGATAIADFVRGLVSAINGVKEFLNPQTDLQRATENLVSAMGDEIRQSQLLSTALGNGVNLSVSAARAKLEEARSRHENVKAIIAEHRAMQLGSDEYQSLSDEIRKSQGSLNSLGFPAIDVAVSRRAEAFEKEQQRLARLLVERQKLLTRDADLEAQLERTAENIATLEEGINTARGGIVVIEPTTYVDPIENTPKPEIKSTGTAAKTVIPDLSDYRQVMQKIAEVFGEASAAGGGFVEMMANARVMLETGQINAEEYGEMVGAIKEHFEDVSSAAEGMERATESAFVSIIDGSKSASDALSDLLKQFASMALNSAFSGLFSGAFDGVAGLFSAPSSAPLTIGSNATGTDNWRGGLTHVNERGGEIMNLPRGTQIIPHDVSMAMAKSAGASRGGSSTVEIRLGEGLEGAILNRAAGQSVQLVRAGMVEQDRRFGGTAQDYQARYR